MEQQDLHTGGGGGAGRVSNGGTGGSGIVILKYLVPVGTTVTHIYKGSGSWVAPEGVTAVDWLSCGWRWRGWWRLSGRGGGGWCRWFQDRHRIIQLLQALLTQLQLVLLVLVLQVLSVPDGSKK
jgi:hypothetical protein